MFYEEDFEKLKHEFVNGLLETNLPYKQCLHCNKAIIWDNDLQIITKGKSLTDFEEEICTKRK